MSGGSAKHQLETEQKLAAAEELLRAIRSGEVDALVVDREGSPAVYTLRSAGEPYKLLIEQMAEGALTVSDNGFILYCNAAFSRIVGLPRERLIGKLFSELTEISLDAIERLAREGRAGKEIDLKTASGLLPALMSTSLVRLEGRPVHCVVITDVSRQGLRLLHEAIVESSADAIYAIDAHGTIRSWNPGAEALHGFSATEAIGANVRILIPAPLRKTAGKRLQRALAGEMLRFDTEYLTKAGHKVHLLVSLAPIQEQYGPITSVAVIARDITERKHAEDEVLSSRAMLEAALASMSDTLAISDAKGNLLHINQAYAAFHKFPNIAATPKNVSDIRSYLEFFTADGKLVPDDRKPTAMALAGETAAAVEYRLRRKDSGDTWVASYSFAPIRDGQGKITGSVVVGRDVTEERKNEARLECLRSDLIQAGRLNELGQISAGLAHELNQPLAAMLNYSNLAKRLISSREPALLENAYNAISKATDQAVRASEIILRMRAFIEKRETNRALEHINEILEGAVALGLVGGPSANTTTRLALAPDLPLVFVDRVQIQQALVNLLRNAVEAMVDSPRRELTLTTTAIDNGAVEVSVTDTGPGIPKEIADKLFMPFVTTKPGGMGIGLLISQSIIEAHGGRIQVISNPGGGTTVRVTLRSAPITPLGGRA